MQTMTLQNYTGASLLNARQLNLSMSLMLGEQTRPKQLTKQQLMQLLNVLESLAMSSKVLFDGSIQQGDKQQLKEALLIKSVPRVKLPLSHLGLTHHFAHGHAKAG